MRQLCFFIILCFAVAGTLQAQEDVLRPHGKKDAPPEQRQSKHSSGYVEPFSMLTFGVEAGINYNVYSWDISWLPNNDNSIWNIPKDGTGFSPYISLIADLPMDKKWGIQGRLSADWKYFSNDGTGNLTRIDIPGFQFPSKYNYDVHYTNIDLSLLFRYNFSDELYGLIGPVVLFNATKFEDKWKQTYSYNGVEYPDGDQTFKADVKVRVGVELGVGYKYSLSKDIWLVPQLEYQWVPTLVIDDFPDIIDGYDLRYKNSIQHSLRLGVGLWFDFYR